MFFRSVVHCVYIVSDRMKKKVSIKKMIKKRKKMLA